MTGLANTNLKPATRLRTVIFSRGHRCAADEADQDEADQRGGGVEGIDRRGVVGQGDQRAAGRRPATEESWKLPLLQVTAREKSWRETKWGRNAELAGQRNVRAVPAAKRQK